MVIGINATPLFKLEKTGIEFTCQNIIHTIIEISRERGDKIVLYVPNSIEPNNPHVTIKKLNWPFRYFWTQLRLGFELILHPPDVYIEISNFLPLISIFSSAKKYFFTHDLSFLTHRQSYSKKNIFYFTIGHLLSGTIASTIFVPTQYTNLQIKRYFSFLSKKVTITGLGIRESLLVKLKTAEQPITLKYNKPYILFVGMIDPKKNLKNLILGFIQWNNQHEKKYQLVITGSNNSWNTKRYDSLLKKLCVSLGSTKDITFTGYVSDQELANLYTHASGLALPSYGEGFGLPIIEALTAGKPVLVSKYTGGISLNFQKSVIFCEPDPKSIACGLEKLIHTSPPTHIHWQTFRKVGEDMYSHFNLH